MMSEMTAICWVNSRVSITYLYIGRYFFIYIYQCVNLFSNYMLSYILSEKLWRDSSQRDAHSWITGKHDMLGGFRSSQCPSTERVGCGKAGKANGTNSSYTARVYMLIVHEYVYSVEHVCPYTCFLFLFCECQFLWQRHRFLQFGYFMKYNVILPSELP